MYNTRRSLYDRLPEKTPKQIFINSLRSEFELSPAESKGVLDLAKSCLFGEVPGSVGKIKYIFASKNARHGKPLSEQELVELELILDNGIDDLQVLKECGKRVHRQLRVLRLNDEIWSLGGSLTQEDLARILGVTTRTRRYDIRELEEDGYFIESEPCLSFLFEQVFATSLNSSNISSNFSPRKYIYEHPLEFFSSQQILT